MPKQSTPIEIGDKTYQLRFTFNSLIRLEKEHGIEISNLETIFPAPDKDGKMQGFKLENFRAFFWAGLIYENKDLTPEDAGELIEDAGGIIVVTEKLTEAFGHAFPADEDVKKK